MAETETPVEGQPEEATGEGAITPRINGSDTFKLAVCNAIRGANPTALVNQFVSLHTSDPGTTGVGEITAGQGSYARVQVTWGAAAMVTTGADTGRAKITASPLVFNVPGGVTIGWYGVWTAQTGGTYLYGKALTPGATLTSAGTVTITPTHAYGLL